MYSKKIMGITKNRKILLCIIIVVAVLSVTALCIVKFMMNGEGSSIKDYQGSKVRVEMESGESFVIELYPEYAPETVANFVNLVNEGFYNGLVFHRVVDGFMAQGGSSDGNGIGGSGTEIKGEFASNGFTQNTLNHTKGVVSMARSSSPDSASSQFFIMYGEVASLDGEYAAFGKVIEGMEVVEAFQEVERTMNSFGEIAIPVEPLVMKTVEMIESDGADEADGEYNEDEDEDEE